MTEWKEYKLGDIIQFGNGKVRPNSIGKVPIFGGNGVLGYCGNSNYNGETIIIGRVGAYCGSVYYQNNSIWISDNALAAKPKNSNNPKFLYYYLKNLNLNNFAEGSSHPLITQTILNSIDILYPEKIAEQKAIASVLSSLDDKIDLLQRQNKTLEQIAETQFKQWFIEEAEESWEEGKLNDVLELVYGKGLKEEIRTGFGYPVVGSNGIFDYHSEYLIKAPGIVIGRKGTLGKVNYMFENFYPVDTTYYIESKINSLGLFYEYFLLKTLKFEDMNSDSAVPGLNRNIAHSSKIMIAPIKLIIEFNEQCKTFFKKIYLNTIQIRTLTLLRDNLLPKLMSGEVRVEVER